MPSTTSGRSVHRSSRPWKSPLSELSPAKVESPRLWYIVGSLSQDGTLTSFSSSATTGVRGKEVRSTAGNFFPPARSAWSVSSKGFPSLVR